MPIFIMKKLIILFSVFFIILSCSKTNKDSVIIGVINENYTRLPVDLAITAFDSSTKLKYVETYESYSAIAKDVRKGYIDMAILPYPEIFKLENRKSSDIEFLSPISRNSVKLIYFNNFAEEEILKSGKLGILENTSLEFLLDKKVNVKRYRNTLKLVADFYHHKLDGIFLFPDKVFKLYGPYKFSDIVEKDYPYFPNSGIVVNKKHYSEKKAEIDSLIFQTKKMVNYILDNPTLSYKISQKIYHYNMRITKKSLYTVSFANHFSQKDLNYFEIIISEMKKEKLLKKNFRNTFLLK